MPRVSLTAGAYREGDSGDRFPTLKLDTNDVARLWVPDQSFAMREAAHTLLAPEFTPDGAVVMTTKSGKNGTKSVFSTAYKGRRLCTGREDVLKAKMMDPDECVICALVKRLADAEIGEAINLRAQTRYALPVVRYNCRTTKVHMPLQVPFSGQVLILGMSQWTWNRVDGVRGQMAEVLNLDSVDGIALDMTDIVVHCESGAWQKYDNIYPVRAARLHDSEQGRAVKAAIEGLWAAVENRPTDADLLAACGKLADDWLPRDLEDVEWAWRKAAGLIAGGGDDPTGGDVFGGANLADGLNDLEAGLFDDQPAADPLAGHPGGTAEFAPADQQAEVAAAEAADAARVSASAATSPAEVSDSLFEETPAAQPAREPATVGAAAPNGAPPKSQSFQDLLKGLEDE
jgi:hypothetical protein